MIIPKNEEVQMRVQMRQLLPTILAILVTLSVLGDAAPLGDPYVEPEQSDNSQHNDS